MASQLELIVGQCDVVFLSRYVTVCHWGPTRHSVSPVEWDVYLTAHKLIYVYTTITGQKKRN